VVQKILADAAILQKSPGVMMTDRVVLSGQFVAQERIIAIITTGLIAPANLIDLSGQIGLADQIALAVRNVMVRLSGKTKVLARGLVGRTGETARNVRIGRSARFSRSESSLKRVLTSAITKIFRRRLKMNVWL